MSLPGQRHLFDIPDGVTYLNAAYMSPLPRAVLDAGHLGLERKARPWEILPEHFFEPVEQARALFAELVGGDAEGVSMVPSVSYGIAVAARNVELAAGHEILTLAEQFPSNVYAWRDLAARSAGRVRTVRRAPGASWTESVLAAIGEATAVVAVPQCHWTDGGLLDLERIGERARGVGAALVIDGCQSVGALPIDVGRVRPDFLVTASYKWLLGPYTHGFLWSAPERRAGRPIEHNWVARRDARDFAGLVRYTDEPAAGARRYDMGGMSNFALMPAATAALRLILGWGVAEIQSTLRGLTDHLAEGAERLGLGVAAAERAGHLIGLRLPGGDPRALAAALSAARVYVSVRGDSVRVAPHLYNDRADMDRLLAVLEEALARTG